jgi:hypothetical protein
VSSGRVDPIDSILRLLDTLTRETEAAEQVAVAAGAATTSPDADTEAGRMRGYAQGLRRAVDLIGDMPI